MSLYLGRLSTVLLVIAAGTFSLSCRNGFQQATSEPVSVEFGNVTQILDAQTVMMTITFKPNKFTVLGHVYRMELVAPNSWGTFNIRFNNNDPKVFDATPILGDSIKAYIDDLPGKLSAAEQAYSIAAHNMRATYFMYLPPESEVPDAALADYLMARWKEVPYEPLLSRPGDYKNSLDELSRLNKELNAAEAAVSRLLGKPLPENIRRQLKVVVTDTTK